MLFNGSGIESKLGEYLEIPAVVAIDGEGIDENVEQIDEEDGTPVEMRPSEYFVKQVKEFQGDAFAFVCRGTRCQRCVVRYAFRANDQRAGT